MKVGICTLGCKVNAYESEYIAQCFKNRGYTIGDFNDICDVYVINTCAVTNTSDVKSKKMIRRAIRQNSAACVVAVGCFMQANQDYHELGLDIVLGNKDKSQIVDLVEEYFRQQKEIKKFYQDFDESFENMAITTFEGRSRAFVKIQDGCENFCSYCIIPYVRGKCRSKAKDIVLKEIDDLVMKGYQEIVLTGIHTGNYGVDLNLNFASLLQDIVKIKNLKRLRISSIEITELTDEVLKIIRDNPVIVDHLHIPLQAGSDAILKAMNRKYDLSYFYDKIQKIRAIRPDISITTDVIVGFPGEDDVMFQDTINTVKKMAFSKIHVFPYSIRTGTTAATMPNQIDNNTKKDRARKLLDVSRQLEIDYFEKFKNKTIEVLVETTKDGFGYGHSGNYLSVKILGNPSVHSIVKVMITDIKYPYLIGYVNEKVLI